jgi:hypothetical protein
VKKDQTQNDIKAVLEYLWHDEQKHYEEAPSRKHIYLVMRRLAKRINYSQ